MFIYTLGDIINVIVFLVFGLLVLLLFLFDYVSNKRNKKGK